MHEHRTIHVYSSPLFVMLDDLDDGELARFRDYIDTEVKRRDEVKHGTQDGDDDDRDGSWGIVAHAEECKDHGELNLTLQLTCITDRDESNCDQPGGKQVDCRQVAR